MDKLYHYSPEDSFFADALGVEAITRSENDTGILRQVNALAEADIRSELNHALINAERRREEAQERAIRDEQDAGLQRQIDTLATALLSNSLNDLEARQRLDEASSTALDEKLQDKIATNDEINEILDEIFP